MDPLEDEWWKVADKGAEEFPIRGGFFVLLLRLSPDSVMYKRSIYTFFDWLGDVGGLMDALRLIGQFLMTLYTLIIGNPLSAFLVSSLFKRGRNIKARKRNLNR